MRLLKFGVLGLLALLLLFPVLTQADTEGTADVTVTLQDVIDVTVVDNLTDATITQTWLDANYGDATAMHYDLGTFTVQIIALTNFNVATCYEWSSNKANPPAFTDDPLELTDEAHTVIGDITLCPTTMDISTYFSGQNNTPGEDYTFDLHIYLDDLGDRAAGEVLTFTVHVYVSDPTDP